MLSSPPLASATARSYVRLLGELPLALIAVTLPVAFSKYNMKKSPPRPVEHGSVTAKVDATAIAASAALPPRRNISMPADVAKG